MYRTALILASDSVPVATAKTMRHTLQGSLLILAKQETSYRHLPIPSLLWWGWLFKFGQGKLQSTLFDMRKVVCYDYLAKSMYIKTHLFYFNGNNTYALSYVVHITISTTNFFECNRARGLKPRLFSGRKRTGGQNQSVRFLETAGALLLVQYFECLCTFRNTAVEQDWRATLVSSFSTCVFGNWHLPPGITIQMKFMKK